MIALATPDFAPVSTREDLAEMYRIQAAIWRDSAREWRALAATMPDMPRFFALENAACDERYAREDDLRAEALATHDVEALV